jgi:hypothetical protein
MFIIRLVQGLRLLWKFRVLVIVWGIMLSIRSMDFYGGNHEFRLAIVTIIATSNIAGRQGNARKMRCRLAMLSLML